MKNVKNGSEKNMSISNEYNFFLKTKNATVKIPKADNAIYIMLPKISEATNPATNCNAKKNNNM